jgi:hypothetical protein
VPSEQDRKVGHLAIGLGVVSLASVARLGVLFLVGDPFGTVNDLGNAAVGILSAALAWTLRGRVGAATFGTGVAASGAAISDPAGQPWPGLGRGASRFTARLERESHHFFSGLPAWLM